MKFFLLLVLSFPVLADEIRGIQVQGSCDIKVTPDRGSVSFTAEHQTKDQKDAVKKTNQQMNDLKERLNKLKLENVEFKTTNYMVTPVRDWEKDRYVDKGFKASMTIDLTTSDISRLGEAMVEGSKAGVQNVGSMTTFLSQEKTRNEYLKCLEVASEDARKKADQLARKLGFKVGDVINIIESPIMQQRPPQPFFEAQMIKSKSMADATPVSLDAGTQNFSTTLQVVFAIR
jgi:uncharacterized protein YggE